MENFLGEKQFTASALITTKSHPKKILLLHHKKAGTWLQPGGHIERTENPVEGLIREVSEETGLDIHSCFPKGKRTKEALTLPLPRFILQEEIPEHGTHAFHYHIDLLYHIEVEQEMSVRILEKEAHSIGWFTLSEALMLPLFDNTREIIQEILK